MPRGCSRPWAAALLLALPLAAAAEASACEDAFALVQVRVGDVLRSAYPSNVNGVIQSNSTEARDIMGDLMSYQGHLLYNNVDWNSALWFSSMRAWCLDADHQLPAWQEYLQRQMLDGRWRVTKDDQFQMAQGKIREFRNGQLVRPDNEPWTDGNVTVKAYTDGRYGLAWPVLEINSSNYIPIYRTFKMEGTKLLWDGGNVWDRLDDGRPNILGSVGRGVQKLGWLLKGASGKGASNEPEPEASAAAPAILAQIQQQTWAEDEDHAHEQPGQAEVSPAHHAELGQQSLAQNQTQNLSAEDSLSLYALQLALAGMAQEGIMWYSAMKHWCEEADHQLPPAEEKDHLRALDGNYTILKEVQLQNLTGAHRTIKDGMILNALGEGTPDVKLKAYTGGRFAAIVPIPFPLVPNATLDLYRTFLIVGDKLEWDGGSLWGHMVPPVATPVDWLRAMGGDWMSAIGEALFRPPGGRTG